MSKQDQAARIVSAAFTVREDGRSFYTRPQLEARIRRAITSAVRKERERCVGIATSVHAENMRGGRGEGAWACEDIIKAIKGGVHVKEGPVDNR